MIEKRTWEEFQNNGLLWWANRILHLIGWAIVIEQEKDGSITDVFPARCKFRGFSEDCEERGFIKVTKYIQENIDTLMKDCEE